MGAPAHEGGALSEPRRRGFVHRLATTLDAEHSLAEIAFCLIMLIGTTSAVRYAFLDPSPDRIETLRLALLLAVAWGVIDAGLGLVGAVFGQGRRRLAARRAGSAPAPVRLGAEDWMTALAVLLATLLASIPVLLPFLVPAPIGVLVWVSNAVATLELAWVGWFWARWTDFPRWLGALGLAVVGLAAVAVTVLLGVA